MRRLGPLLLLLCLLLTGCGRAEAPPETTADSGGLDYCRALARDMERRYGIQILFGEEAAARAPWDYEFTPEPEAGSAYRQLTDLDRYLGCFPKELLAELFSSPVTVCLVQKISGVPGTGSMKTAGGLQFDHENGLTLALAAGPHSDRALYHELYHLMEPRLVFGTWNELNPEGFVYENSHTPPRHPSLAQGNNRAFIDEYAMTYPAEDRARIFEYAMAPDNEALFNSDMLQAKLRTLCAAIREAYSLDGECRWEQYLT